MKKFYMLLVSVLAFVGMANAQTQHLGEVYEGSLTINFGGPIPLENQSVYIKDNGNGTCTFALYGFKLDPTMHDMGDIIVENTKVTTDDKSNKTYDGATTQNIILSLEAPGANDIEASATITGTETSTGALDVTIDVLWLQDNNGDGKIDPGEGMPIPVTFKGQRKTSGVNSVVANNAVVYGANGAINVAGFNGVANVYSISGQLVKSAKVANNASIEMPVGIYFVRTGAAAAKVIVK